MGLTTGSGPFGPSPGGTVHTRDGRFVLVEPFPRRVRAVRAGHTVVDSEHASMVHAAGSLPRYSFPRADVHLDAGDGGDAGDARDDPQVAGNVLVPWGAADAWFEEDERILVHPRDPYHRIDTFSTSRRITVRCNGVELAASTRARALYETGLPVRWYLVRADVRMEHLERTATVTECPYKGAARYWSAKAPAGAVPDAAWSYEEDVRREGEPVQWCIAFDDTKVDVLVGDLPS